MLGWIQQLARANGVPPPTLRITALAEHGQQVAVGLATQGKFGTVGTPAQFVVLVNGRVRFTEPVIGSGTVSECGFSPDGSAVWYESAPSNQIELAGQGGMSFKIPTTARRVRVVTGQRLRRGRRADVDRGLQLAHRPAGFTARDLGSRPGMDSRDGASNLAPVSDQRQPSVYGWQASIVFAVVGTAISVALIIIFTELVGWVGDFWSQVIYFLALGGGIVAAALRSRRKDAEDPDRLRRGGTPITPAGLPGPFVVTQALGVSGDRDAGRRAS